MGGDAGAGRRDEILAKAKEEERAKTARGEAEEWRVKLLEGRDVPASEIIAAAHANGYSWTTIKRVKRAIGVSVARRSVSGTGLGEGGWLWSLPPKP